MIMMTIHMAIKFIITMIIFYVLFEIAPPMTLEKKAAKWVKRKIELGY